MTKSLREFTGSSRASCDKYTNCPPRWDLIPGSHAPHAVRHVTARPLRPAISVFISHYYIIIVQQLQRLWQVIRLMMTAASDRVSEHAIYTEYHALKIWNELPTHTDFTSISSFERALAGLSLLLTVTLKTCFYDFAFCVTSRR